jgi:hypothetical protein
VFPDPLGPDGKAVPALEGDVVSMPLAYWLKIAEYQINVERLRQEYEAWLEVWEK